MKLLWLTCLLIGTAIGVHSKAVCHNDASRGYYWRDYTGVIPPDAIPGGSINGTVTYIGQVLFSNAGMLIPGEIHPETKTIYYEYYNAAFTATEDIKILCTQHVEDFAWVDIKARDSIYSAMDSSTSLIIGGREGSHIITVGTASDSNNNERVGKVIISDNTFDAMYFAEEGKRLHPSSFKVLVYNPIPCINEPTNNKENYIIISNA